MHHFFGKIFSLPIAILLLVLYITIWMIGMSVVAYDFVKAGWRTVGGKRCYFRSKAEANYARYLEYQKSRGLIADWEHEPQTFWFENIKRGVRSYKPDFRVTKNDGEHEWFEVKGYFDAKSKTKIKRFAKYYPKESLRVIESKWFSSCKSRMKVIIPEWE